MFERSSKSMAALITLLVLLPLSGCQQKASIPKSVKQEGGIGKQTVTPTATEVIPTFTLIPAATSEQSVVSQKKKTPLPEKSVQLKDDSLKILILGTDQKVPGQHFRTDAIMLMVIHRKTKTVNVLSIPRDLYVEIPGRGMGRINTAYVWGGYSMLAETLEINFGVSPDYYVMIDSWYFPTIVDNLGGVDVQVHEYYCVPEICVSEGEAHMDGEMAAEYVFSRSVGDDLDRQFRQWEVLMAIFDKLQTMNPVTKAPELYKTYKHHVTTNLSLKDLISLIPMAKELQKEVEINHYAVDWPDVVTWKTPGGAQVLLQEEDRVRKKFYQALHSK